MAEQIEHFGQTRAGEAVYRVRLANGSLQASIITYGASVQDLRFQSHDAPLVLGFEDIAAYENHGMFFGSTVGRCANRIGNAHFKLDGNSYALIIRDGEKHQLHGGPNGFSNRIWKIEEVAENSVLLRLKSADGDMGYPGRLIARCRYHLTHDNALKIEISAQSDVPTICNMCNHAYFNLEDGGAVDVNLHRLQIDAETILEVDANQLPTGQQIQVSGTQFDFRAIRPIGEFHGYDHNYCLSDQRESLRQVARLVAPSSGMVMDIETSEAGLQLYTAPHIPAHMEGLEGIAYGPGSAVCLEAQVWPNAINHAHFPNVVLRPNERLDQTTIYRFSKQV